MKRFFPPDICSRIESVILAQPSSPNESSVLDGDWFYVSCVLSRNRDEITVTLRGATVGHDDTKQASFQDSTAEDTHIAVAADDLDVLNGRALDLDIALLVVEQLEVFSRQTSPDEVGGMIRLPGWNPAF